MAKAQQPAKSNQPESSLEELARRQKYEQGRLRAKTPKKLGDVLPSLMAKRGYAQVRTGDDLQQAWSKAVGSRLAKFTRAGRLQRGILEVIVSNSTVLQELKFADLQILSELNKLAPEAKVQKFRFRTGKLA